MKRIGLLVVAVFGVLILTGCGGKTLTCTNSESTSGLSMDQKIVATFNGEKVSRMKLEVEAKATSDLYKKNWDTLAKTLEEQYSNKNKDGIKVTTSNKNYTYKISIDIDVKKAKDEDLKDYDLDGIASNKDSYDDAKKELESAGFKCK